jgi:hypothetical protein
VASKAEDYPRLPLEYPSKEAFEIYKRRLVTFVAVILVTSILLATLSITFSLLREFSTLFLPSSLSIIIALIVSLWLALTVSLFLVDMSKQVIYLLRTYLWGANLQGADLQKANLVRADLNWANLERANLPLCQHE